MYGLEGDRVVGGGGERITAEAVSFVFKANRNDTYTQGNKYGSEYGFVNLWIYGIIKYR